jgi:hypothetical protein
MSSVTGSETLDSEWSLGSVSISQWNVLPAIGPAMDE